MGHIPCCGLLSTLAVNTFVLMLMMFGSTNLDNSGLALILKSTLEPVYHSGYTFSSLIFKDLKSEIGLLLLILLM